MCFGRGCLVCGWLFVLFAVLCLLGRVLFVVILIGDLA